MSEPRPIVIACVTFETAKVVEPILALGATEVFLFHYVQSPSEVKGSIYSMFYQEVCDQLVDALPLIRIHEISSFPLWELTTLVREISNIVSDVRKADKRRPILINVSAGTTEFGIAGAMVALRHVDVDYFTVASESYSVPIDEVMKIYFRDGRPVGLTDHCRNPEIGPKFDMQTDEENLIRALRVFIRYFDIHHRSLSKEVATELRNAGFLTDESDKWDATHYNRHYRDIWMERGWIVRNEKQHRRYEPSERGRLVAEMFYTR